jgi:hypothetical protein
MLQTALMLVTFLNIRGEGTHCVVCTYSRLTCYGDSGHAASCDGSCTAPYDVIIASDVVYSTNGARLLAQSIPANLRPGGVFLMVLAGCGFLSRSDKFLCLAPHFRFIMLMSSISSRLTLNDSPFFSAMTASCSARARTAASTSSQVC